MINLNYRNGGKMSRKKKEVNILVCGNKKVFDGILTGMISILNRTNATLNYYVFTMDVTRLKE